MELMVGLTISLVGLAGLLGFYSSMVRGSASGEQATDANIVATQTLEEIRGLTHEEIVAIYGPGGTGGSLGGAMAGAGGGDPFDLIPFVRDLDAVTGTGNQVFRRELTLSYPINERSGDSYHGIIKTTVRVVWMDRGAEDVNGNEHLRHALVLELLRTNKEDF